MYLNQIDIILEKIGYIKWRDKDVDVTILVPKDSSAIAVAEIIDSSVSYKTIEYNHHSMKGDMDKKEATLMLLANQLEPKRAILKSLNKSLEDDLFYLLNNINIRHNNTDSDSTKYKKAVADMSKEELASMMSLNRPSLSRELMRMRDEGLIEYDRNSITLLA